MKKVISFDLDGTIVDGRYGNMVWLEGLPERYAEQYSLPVAEAKAEVKRAYDSVGEGDLLWYDIDYWIRRFDLTVPVPDLLDRYRDYIRLLPHVAEVIEALAGRYELVIASNAARIFVDKELGHTGIARYFSRVISATSDFEMVKKEEGFYRRLCAVCNVSPAELAHVGDHRVFDFDVPRMVGIDSFHYDPTSVGDGRVISDFRELLDRL
ncbi:MAG: HAD family hydrolase [Syntrophorhabdales bacterium]|jgi:putative hydrolase of the HAD superfamily